MRGGGRVPGATYRVQLHAGFDFDAAAAIVPYLAGLGITHLYCSPYLQAAPGSTHGYDVVDHGRVNEELGGREGLERLHEALGAHGLGQVLDIVPNHMAITGRENRLWWDVLEDGPASLYAPFFDVDWDPPEEKLRNTVLLAILGDHYGRVLEAGGLRVARDPDGFVVRYYDNEAPVAPRTLATPLAAAAREIDSTELAEIAEGLGLLPAPEDADRFGAAERHRTKEALREALLSLLARSPAAASAVDRALERLNGDVEALDAVLERQSYRLAFWRTAGRELDYRRFFDVTGLIGLRAEDEAVFAHTHRLVLDLVADGVVDGLRIDHPDGLRDPEGYLTRLAEAAPDAWIVAEKILEPGERLPSSWPVAGTTGYDFLNLAGGVLVDPGGEDACTSVYAGLTGGATDWEEVMRDKKLLVTQEVLAADLNRLTALFVRVCEAHRRHRDYTRHELREALRETAAAFPVYRSYVRPGRPPTEDDVAHVDAAVEDVRRRRPDLDPELPGFLGDLLLLRVPGTAETELAVRFQQFSAPVMAKGVEDTAFYTYARLVALNEVGGSPGRFGVRPEEFHAACADAAERHPTAMLAGSTHDTKRSEDVRARLALLSEQPGHWRQSVERLRALAAPHRTDGLPDRNAQYLLFQTLAGAWPLDAARAVAYMEKASKEAKEHTSWIDPVPTYDEALRRFVEGVLGDARFVAELEAIVAPLVAPGRVNSLAQLLLRLTAPGVPDVYQGTELWDLSLVDPDNRRPVDYERRRALLAESARLDASAAWRDHADDGLPKLLVLREALALRAARPAAFGPEAGYLALPAVGPAGDHVLAFARGVGAGRAGAVVAVVPRLPLRLEAAGGWRETSLPLPPGCFRDVLTGTVHAGPEVRLVDLLGGFPVALLAQEDVA